MALATIAGVGDLVPYRRLEFPGRSLYSTLDGAFAIANLEVPLTRRDEPQREGIVLSGDHGYGGIEDTAQACSRAHMLTFGHGRSSLEAFKPCIVPAGVWGGRIDL